MRKSATYGDIDRAQRDYSASRRSGFTLVELLIVIIILAVLATVAIPIFKGSVEDAPLVQLESNLCILRDAIELYYHQHDATYPGVKRTNGSGQTIASAVQAKAAFLEQLTLYTDVNGGTSPDKTVQYKLGPYLRTGIPKNPFIELGGVTCDLVNDGRINIIADDASAWRFYRLTGVVRPNDQDHKTL